jgi:hypothetical protein
MFGPTRESSRASRAHIECLVESGDSSMDSGVFVRLEGTESTAKGVQRRDPAMPRPIGRVGTGQKPAASG